MEDQALARIHRMGQTREVTTVRFFVRNSFEEASAPRTTLVINATDIGLTESY